MAVSTKLDLLTALCSVNTSPMFRYRYLIGVKHTAQLAPLTLHEIKGFRQETRGCAITEDGLSVDPINRGCSLWVVVLGSNPTLSHLFFTLSPCFLSSYPAILC